MQKTVRRTRWDEGKEAIAEAMKLKGYTEIGIRRKDGWWGCCAKELGNEWYDLAPGGLSAVFHVRQFFKDLSSGPVETKLPG